MTPNAARPAWIVLLPCLYLAPCVALAQPSIAEIERAWIQRQERLVSGHVKWVERDSHPKGSKTKLIEGMRGTTARSPIPPEDMTTETNVELTWAGDRINYRFEGWTIGLQNDEYVPAVRREVLTAADSRGLWENRASEYPSGLIAKRANLISHGSIKLKPILYWLRPLDVPNGGVPLKACRIAAGTRTVGDRECLILSRTAGTRTEEWLLDPQRDFLIRHYVSKNREQVRAKITLDYQPDPRIDWALSRWHVLLMYGRESLETDSEATMTSFAVNGPIDESNFKLVFPPGTRVTDEVRNLDYLVLASGKERIITAGERRNRVTYKELMATEAGLGGTAPPLSLRSWALWAASLTLVGLLVATLLRKYRSARMN